MTDDRTKRAEANVRLRTHIDAVAASRADVAYSRVPASDDGSPVRMQAYDLSDAMSMTKRYFTSLRSMRS